MHTSHPERNLWTHTAAPAPETQPLTGDVSADVAVVGGGFTGLSAALHLAKAGSNVVLLEANDMGFGASGRNNGQVIPTYSRANPDDIVAEFGADKGEQMNAWVAGSADLVFDLIRRHGIDCDASQEGWLQPAHRPGRMAAVRNKYEQWAKRGARVELLDGAATVEITGSDHYRHGGWLHRSGGHIQPLGYARGLARAAQAAGATLYRDSPVNTLARQGVHWQLATSRGTVTADQVILATNGYTDSLWPKLKRTIVPVRSFHAATHPMGDNVARTVLPRNHGLSDTRQALWAFRKDRFGRLITTAAPLFTTGATGSVQAATAKRMREVFPQMERPEPEFVWEGIIAMTVERLPRFHELAGGVYAGLGYSGRGIAMATAMGKLMAERATGRATADLPVPAAEIRTLPMHDLVVPLSRAMVLLYQWKDARG